MSKRTVTKEIIHIKKTLLSSKFIKDFTHLALKSKAAFQLLFIVLLGVGISLLPIPDGLTREAWLFFTIFFCVIVGLITEPYPPAFIGLFGVVVACLFRIGPTISMDTHSSTSQILTWGLSGFSNGTVWLIFVAFMFASGFQKTGLGKRIAFLLVHKLGKRTLGLGYAIALSDLLLAPIMPSNTARSGGTIFPIIKHIPLLYDSTPQKDPRKIGSYITWVALATTCVTSSMFLTALAPNILAVDLVKGMGIDTPSWGEWFFLFLPVGLILVLAIPLLTYYIYPPSIKKSIDVPKWAKEELAKMGKITRKELVMIFLFIIALLLWILGEKLQINATLSALTILSMMIILNILDWNDILSNKPAWNVFIWFGTLVTLSAGLSNVGFLNWFAENITAMISSFSPHIILLLMLVTFFLIHYFFASITAHVTALLVLFIATAKGIPGMDIQLLTYLLLYSIGLMGIITPYGAGPSPIWYNFGYISSKKFWSLGALFGLFYLLVLIFVGIPWIKWWI